MSLRRVSDFYVPPPTLSTTSVFVQSSNELPGVTLMFKKEKKRKTIYLGIQKNDSTAIAYC